MPPANPVPSQEAVLTQRLELIDQLSARLASGGRLQEHVQFATKEVCDVLRADACVIRTLAEDDLVLLGTHGVDSDFLAERLPIDEGIACKLVGDGEPVVIDNAATHPLTAELHARHASGPGHFRFVSFAGTPMVSHGEVCGVLAVYSIHRVKKFSATDISLLQILANTLAVTMENETLLRRFSNAREDIRQRIISLLDVGETQPEAAQKHDETAKPKAKKPENTVAQTRDQGLRLEYELRNAGDEIVIFYQPLSDPHSCQVRGYEALMRWEHPRLGMLGPNLFIPMAERTGLIEGLGWHLAEKAMEEFAALKQMSGGSASFVCLNTSVIQLAKPFFCGRLKGVAERYGVSTDEIVIEITERYMLEPQSEARHSLLELAQAGFQIFVDDFGAGYSSFSHLLELPVRGVKIDKSFLPAAPDDERRYTLVRSITEMAHQLALIVIAEGIETDFQLNVAREIGVDLAQGFGVGIPARAYKAAAK